MSYPLAFNEEYSWDYDISIKKPKVFFVMEHTRWIFDLSITFIFQSSSLHHFFFLFFSFQVGDFSYTEQSVNELTAILYAPFKSTFHINLEDFAFYLNSNQENLIDNPNDLNENGLKKKVFFNFVDKFFFSTFYFKWKKLKN